MTSLTLGLLLPASVLISAGIAVSRFSWRQYPAWISAMLWQVFIYGSTMRGHSPAWVVPISAAMLAAMIIESATRSRERVDGTTGARWFSLALVSAASLSSIAAGLSAMQRAYLFRSNCLWLAALAMCVLCLLRLRVPVLERKCDRIYRYGVTLWIAGMALSGSFVRGGVGYRVFPQTSQTWHVVNTAAYAWVIVLLPSMAALMAASAPGRKRAAKRPDGRTVTGLIEMEKAA